MSTEPQSIIHQVLRLEQRLRKAVSSRYPRSPRKVRKSTVETEIDVSMSFAALGRGLSASSEDLVPEAANLSEEYSQHSSAEHSEASLSSLESCQTMDQNELMSEVIIQPTEGEMSFVHFFIEGSAVSEAIDEQMRQLESRHPLCKFARIDASLAPYIARRLNTPTGKPSVVALKNGKLMNRICNFDTKDCSELQNWMYTVELIRMFQ